MSERISVLLMVYSLNEGGGGTERQVVHIAKALDRSEFDPHLAAVIVADSMRADLRAAGVSILQLPLQSFFSWSFPRSLRLFRGYLRENRIGIVHAFDPTSAIFSSAAGWVAGFRCLLSSQRAYRSLSFRRYRPMLRISDRIVDGIIVNCDAMRRHLVDDERVPAARVHVCYNTINTERFQPAEPRAHPEALTIGTACVFRAEKDLGCLIKAFASIHALYHDVRLMIVGRGPEEQNLRTLAADLALTGRCQFVPFQNGIEQYLRQIDIFVLPSTSEALSNSLMEAMACGCCCIGSRIGGTPELIHDGKTGLLFPAGDASLLADRLRLLIENPKLRAGLSKAGTLHIRENFSEGQSISRIQDMYRNFFHRKLHQTVTQERSDTRNSRAAAL